MTGAHVIEAVAVIVPVHDEEELLSACLSSIRTSASQVVDVPIAIFVVLDACTDGSVSIAAHYEVQIVTVDARNVGIARTAGVDAAARHFRDISPSRLWTAHTDADSVVPPNWLTHQLTAAARGMDVVVGTVRPDFRDLDESRRRAWLDSHTPGEANGHVHGANLGIRASTLASSNGFEPIPEHEDVRMVDRVKQRGGRITASSEAEVLTSGRTVGRTPGGYARYLRDDLVRRVTVATAPAES